jgi:hypothetical protein
MELVVVRHGAGLVGILEIPAQTKQITHLVLQASQALQVRVEPPGKLDQQDLPDLLEIQDKVHLV